MRKRKKGNGCDTVTGDTVEAAGGRDMDRIWDKRDVPGSLRGEMVFMPTGRGSAERTGSFL